MKQLDEKPFQQKTSLHFALVNTTAVPGTRLVIGQDFPALWYRSSGQG